VAHADHRGAAVQQFVQGRKRRPDAGVVADRVAFDGDVEVEADQHPFAGDVEIVEIEITPDAPVAGKRLDEVRLPRGTLIIVDYQGNRLGGPDTVLEVGHRYVVAVESDVADEVMNLMRG